MKKFTKGNWETSQQKKNEQYGDQTYFSITTDNMERVGNTYKAVGFYYPHSVQSFEEMIANANLLAAAPELLEALKEVVYQVGVTIPVHEKPFLNKAIDQAFKAINKATT